MRIRKTLSVAAAVIIAVAGLAPGSPAQAEDPEYPLLIGAGDIATCYSYGAEATAQLIEEYPTAEVFSTGDSNQGSGSLDEYEMCFDPTWGRFKERIHPVPGNHDYVTPRAAGYFDYFGPAAGERGKGYYAYEVGDWLVIALNSVCIEIQGGCGVGSPQETWLRRLLETSTKKCSAAYWHYPLFTSGSSYGPSYEMAPLYQALYDGGVEIVMSGHNHIYERFAPQTTRGVKDLDYGVRQFNVGTGGASHYGVGWKISANSEVRNTDTFGVLKLTLKPDSYDWEFLPEEGEIFTDQGSTDCHGKPPVPPEWNGV